MVGKFVDSIKKGFLGKESPGCPVQGVVVKAAGPVAPGTVTTTVELFRRWKPTIRAIVHLGQRVGRDASTPIAYVVTKTEDCLGS